MGSYYFTVLNLIALLLFSTKLKNMYKGTQNSTKAVERGLPAIDWPGKAGQNRGTTMTPYPLDMFISMQ